MVISNEYRVVGTRPIRPDGDARGAAELTGTIAFPADCADRPAEPVEDPDALRGNIGHVNDSE